MLERGYSPQTMSPYYLIRMQRFYSTELYQPFRAQALQIARERVKGPNGY